MVVFKKGQVILYLIIIMLIVGGYLNYTINTNKAIETSSHEYNEIESNTDSNANVNSNLNMNANISANVNNTSENESTNIGDARLVSSNDVTNSNDYFAKSKLERDTMYSQMIESYEKVLNSSNSMETQKQTATQEITRINQTKNSIMVCENLIQTKGFKNSVIFVNGDSVSVIIESEEELKKEDVAQIQNIIAREMNTKIENIHISSHK